MPHSSQIPPHLRSQAEDPNSEDNARPTSLPFKLVILFTGLFAFTVLAWTIAVMFGDAEIPVNRWLDRNAAMLMTVELAAAGVCTLIALTRDRRENWKRYEAQLAAYEARMVRQAAEAARNVAEADAGGPGEPA